MAQGVVDFFEVVQVNEQHRQFATAAPGLTDILLQPVAQHAAVGQAGQGV